MKKTIALLFALSLVLTMAGCSHNTDVSIANSELLGDSAMPNSATTAQSGDVKIYPTVQDDIKLYVDDTAIQGDYRQSDIDELTALVNGYANIAYNIGENFTGEGVEDFTISTTKEELVKVNEGIKETVQGVQLFNVAYGSNSIVNIDYVIKASHDGDNLPAGVYNFVEKMTVEKIDGKWIGTKLLSSGNYPDTQHMLRDSITHTVYMEQSIS